MTSVLNHSLVNNILFPCPPSSYDTSLEGLVWIHPVSYTSSSSSLSSSIPCLVLRNTRPANFCLVYFHGNGEDLGLIAPYLAEYGARLGVDIVAPEYPGYGLCAGTACETGVLAVADEVLRFCTGTLQVPLERMVVFGRSVGTGPASHLAANHELAAVVLQSPFLSVKALAKTLVGKVATAMVNRFDNHGCMPHVRSPIMIIHGMRDQLIPYQHSEELFKRANNARAKALVLSEEADHNEFDEVNDVILPLKRFMASDVEVELHDARPLPRPVLPPAGVPRGARPASPPGFFSKTLGVGAMLLEMMGGVFSDDPEAVDPSTAPPPPRASRPSSSQRHITLVHLNGEKEQFEE